MEYVVDLVPGGGVGDLGSGYGVLGSRVRAKVRRLVVGECGDDDDVRAVLDIAQRDLCVACGAAAAEGL